MYDYYDTAKFNAFNCVCKKCASNDVVLVFDPPSPYADEVEYLIGVGCKGCGNREVLISNDSYANKAFLKDGN